MAYGSLSDAMAKHHMFVKGDANVALALTVHAYMIQLGYELE